MHDVRCPSCGTQLARDSIRPPCDNGCREAIGALTEATERHALATEILALFTWELAVGVMRRDDDRPSDVERAAVRYIEARLADSLPRTCLQPEGAR